MNLTYHPRSESEISRDGLAKSQIERVIQLIKQTKLLGGLVTFSLILLLVGAAEARGQITETFTFTTNRVVPDGNAAGLSETRTLSSAVASIASVELKLKVSGEFNGDLYAYLRHGSGFTILLNRPGRSASNSPGYDDSGLDVTFQETETSGDVHLYQNTITPTRGSPLTGIWEPDGRTADPGTVTEASFRAATLASFHGLNAAGDWTLYLADLESGGTNMLTGWELNITGTVFPTLAWSPPDITYGTALGASQLNAVFTHSGTNVAGTFSYSPSAGTVLDAGNAQTLSVTFTPTDSASFLPITTTTTINVLTAPLTLTAADKKRAYGESNPVLDGSFTGVQNGDVLTANYNCLATTISAVGNYAIVTSAGGSRLTNYTVTLVDGRLTVDPAPLTVAATDASRLYGASNPVLTGTITGIQNNEDLTVTCACSASPASPVGSYAIVPTAAGATLPNYAVTLVTGTLAVGHAPLVITANDTSRIFGAPNPSFTGTITGIQNSDPITATYSTLATASSATGAYPIVPTPSGANLSNYSVTLNNGTLTVGIATSSAVLASSANPQLPGNSVTFSLTVSAVSPATGTPSGSIQFRIDGSQVGSPVALTSGVAAFSTSSLTHGAHTVSAVYAGSGNFTGSSATLNPVQKINTPPVAGAYSITRYPTQGVKLWLSDLLASDSDADGDSLSIFVSSSSLNGGTIAVRDDWAYFTPATGFTSVDSFTYALTDGQGGSATGTVMVAIQVDTDPTQNLMITDLGVGNLRIDGSGIPGRSYRLQYTSSLTPASWQLLPGASVRADEEGVFGYTDHGVAGQRYYRSLYP